jgi:hypothetical protein
MRIWLAFLTALMLAGGSTCLAQPNLHMYGEPKWFEVTGGQTSASAVMVYSAATHQVVGTIPARERFLSFGENDQWVTFAYGGQTAYVPIEMVTEVYPKAVSLTAEMRGWGPTLEEQRAQDQAKFAEMRRNKVALKKSFTNTGSGAAGMPGGMGMYPGGSFANYATNGPPPGMAPPAGGNMGVGGGKYM